MPPTRARVAIGRTGLSLQRDPVLVSLTLGALLSIGWYLARHYKTKEPKQLDNATVRAHIDGDFTVNLYSSNPDTQRCKWVAIDADYEGSMKDLLQLRYELKQDSIQAALEQSRLDVYDQVTSGDKFCATQR